MELRLDHHQSRRLMCGTATLLMAILLLGGVYGGAASASPWVVRGDLQSAQTTWEVNTVNDSGPGSLRYALANALAGDRIVFDIAVFPPEAPGVITVTGDVLPTIKVDDLTIDAVGRGVILDGEHQITHGLSLQADNTTIQGLHVRHFTRYGVSMSGATNCLIGGNRELGEGNVISGNESGHGIMLDGPGTDDSTIAGNIIGADPSGMSPVPNGGGVLIRLGAKRNIIGGQQDGYGNLISGNASSGISIQGNGTDHTVIQGNLIGTDMTGENHLGNGLHGIRVNDGPDHTVVGGGNLEARNIIAGNGGVGISIAGVSTNYTQVLGNFVGVDQSGTWALPNNRGILIASNARYTHIGGDMAAARNVISGNTSTGVQIESTSDTTVQGNYIGTDPSGTAAIPNRGDGIQIAFNGNNTVGGPLQGDGCTGTCNLVSGNLGVGIAIYSSGGNTIQGNYVGSDWTGEEALGNGQVGIRLNILGTDANIIGGTQAGAGNVIRFNQGGGVTLTVSTSSNTLTGNHIENNRGTAIRYHPGNILGVNHCSGNDPNLVEVRPGPLYAGDLEREGETWLAQGDLTRFVVVNDPGLGDDIIVQPGSTWTVGPGVEVLFDFNEGAWIQGHLDTQGTPEQPVIFGSAQRYTAPLRGDWLGMSFATGSSGSLSHTTVEFARTGIGLEGGHLALSNSVITASERDGIYVGTGSTLNLDGNTIAGNGRYGIFNPNAVPIDARETWWGHASGPDGLGDPVIGGQVDYSSWMTDPGYNDSWKFASVLNPGTHTFAITSYQDLDWFRVPVGTRNATVTASLSQLPRDYDLFMFSQLGSGRRDADDLARTMTIGQTALLGDLDVASQSMTLARTMTIGQLADVADGFETGNMVAASSQPGTVDEELSIDVWNRSGWYYILVAGHNGANSPQEYLLHITITPGLPVIEPGFEPPTFDPPDFVAPEVKTLIFTHGAQLEARFGSTEALMDKLGVLAEQTEVAGTIIDFNAIKAIDDTYTLWSENPNNPVYANLVAGAIRAWLDVNRAAYPNLEHLVIVGGDGIVPFWRVPDEVPLAHEGTYAPHLASGSPTGSALGERYFLTDDYYGGFTLIPWRGRNLVFPEFGIGRLVETPEEMMAAIDAFLDSPTLAPTDALVTGYDFMTDGADAMADHLAVGGLAVTRLIDDVWTADDLRLHWLEGGHDISAINAHFEHWQAIPAEPVLGAVTAVEAAASGTLGGTLNYSIGCHSGLNTPDGEATDHATDFPQALLGGGAAWIGNTGYGYGDADAVGYSELLMNIFSQNVSEGQALGHALRAAKAEYFNTTGTYSFSPYDEKVLAQATLYGLPMLRVSMPVSTASVKNSSDFGWVSASGRSDGLVTRQLNFDLAYETHTDPEVGTYFSVGGETEVNEWQPIQPRTSLDISLEGETPHGAFFEGGTYETIEDSDPVISRLISTAPDLDFQDKEPTFDHPDIWHPSWWSLVNRVWIDEGVNERLVVIPAQYQSTTPTMGTQRLFEQMNYTVYYSHIIDIVPPSIWRVNAYRLEAESHLTVEVTDLSDVIRVGISFTLGDGSWETIDLEHSTANPNLWRGTMPYEESIEWFVQAVDGAGNVAVNDNKGAYFGPPPNRIWLPVITREL
ncbi:MAG: right-handed parallel beta-helix repeat-containing protein [Anaerolineae bacterium]